MIYTFFKYVSANQRPFDRTRPAASIYSCFFFRCLPVNLHAEPAAEVYEILLRKYARYLGCVHPAPMKSVNLHICCA